MTAFTILIVVLFKNFREKRIYVETKFQTATNVNDLKEICQHRHLPFSLLYLYNMQLKKVRKRKQYKHDVNETYTLSCCF